MDFYKNATTTTVNPNLINKTFEYSEYSSKLLPNDSAFFIYYNVFNPHSILYTNAPSEFGVSVGLLKFIIQGVGVTSLCIFGVIGNLLSILVLSSPRMGATSTSHFLRCLAICDTGVILCVTLVVGIPSLLVFNPDGSKVNSTWLVFNKRIVQYSRAVWTPPIFQTGVICSVLFTMALTMDRYLAICRPFLTLKHDLCSRRKARYVTAFLLIGDILYNLPRYWENEYLEVVIPEVGNLTVAVPVPTSLRKNFYYDSLYVHMSYVLLLFLAPVIYLIIFNIIIYRKIRESRRLRKTMALASLPLKSQDTSLAYMLFGIVIVFVICQVVPVGHATYRYASGDVGTDAYAPEVEFLMTFFFVLNCSLNFLIYCVSGTKFRKAMAHVVLTCAWKI